MEVAVAERGRGGRRGEWDAAAPFVSLCRSWPERRRSGRDREREVQRVAAEEMERREKENMKNKRGTSISTRRKKKGKEQARPKERANRPAHAFESSPSK